MTQHRSTAADLPEKLVEVAETIGLRLVLRLVEHFGGLDMKFPKEPGPEHPLVKALGETDAAAICHYFKGGSVYVPHARNLGRRRSVERMLADGMSTSQVAREMGFSARHVRRIATSPTKDPRQITLFDD